MSSDRFSLRPSSDLAEWDAFVATSPQGSAFLRSDYLQALGRRFEIHDVLKGEAIRAKVIVFVTPDGSAIEIEPWVPYAGICFAPPAPAQRHVKLVSEQFKITEVVIATLYAGYQSAAFSLPTAQVDVRPYLWHEYHSADASLKYRAEVRYTTTLDITGAAAPDFGFESAMFRGLGDSRQGELKKARKLGCPFAASDDLETFLAFYEGMWLAQDKPVAPGELALIRRLCETSLGEGFAKLYVASRASGEPDSFAFFLHDARRAYYLFGTADPAQRETYSGTVVLWQAFRELAQLGIPEVDFVGANSPQRGAFKLSLGGVLVPYYQVTRGKF